MGSRGMVSTRASSKMVSMHFARNDSLSIAGRGGGGGGEARVGRAWLIHAVGTLT